MASAKGANRKCCEYKFKQEIDKKTNKQTNKNCNASVTQNSIFWMCQNVFQCVMTH